MRKRSHKLVLPSTALVTSAVAAPESKSVAGATTSDNIPYHAPELQMLFKSKSIRPKDNVDAAEGSVRGRRIISLRCLSPLDR